MNTTTSVEFGHFYVSRGVDGDCLKSIDVFEATFNQSCHRTTNGHTYDCRRELFAENGIVTNVLIDDVGASEAAFRNGLHQIIATARTQPDYFCRESKFADAADQIVNSLDPDRLVIRRFKDKTVLMLKSDKGEFGLIDFGQERKKYTCALLSCAWTLARLGAIKVNKREAMSSGVRDIVPFICDQTLTILPKAYEANENKVLEIIKLTSFAHLLPKIDYLYF